MYYYLKSELQRRSLCYAEVQRHDEIIFVIATDKDHVIEAFFTFRNGDCAFGGAEINSGNFNAALQNYMDGTLNGIDQTIQVKHNENVVKLQS
jgi:hypothetical protein